MCTAIYLQGNKVRSKIVMRQLQVKPKEIIKFAKELEVYKARRQQPGIISMTEVWSILRQHLQAEIQTKIHNKQDANTLLQQLNFSNSVDQLENYTVVFG